MWGVLKGHYATIFAPCLSSQHKHRHKHGSAENLVEMGSPSHTSSSKSNRTSVPIITFQEGRPGSPPPPGVFVCPSVSVCLCEGPGSPPHPGVFVFSSVSVCLYLGGICVCKLCLCVQYVCACVCVCGCVCIHVVSVCGVCVHVV